MGGGGDLAILSIKEIVCVCVCFTYIQNGFSTSYVLKVVKFRDVINFTATGMYSLMMVWLCQNMSEYPVHIF